VVGPLAFYDVQPQIVTKWPENDPAFHIMETVLGIIAAIAFVVVGIATFGAAFVVGAIIIGLLAGAVALTKMIIDEIGTANAPASGALVLNSTAPITWTGDKAFHLTSAGLNGSMQLGGVMVPAAG
jgi:hypothetical protein